MAGIAFTLSSPAWAHSFGRVYNLPVPFWLYGWGAAMALIASFLVLGYFLTARDEGALSALPRWQCRLPHSGAGHWPFLILKFGSVGSLLLCIVTGFWGSSSPYGNFNMTFFWIVFVLGFTYLTALTGDLFAALNPWLGMAQAVGSRFPRYAAGLLRYPAGFGYWPALAFYMAFIWIELFARTGPFSLATILAAYSLINLAGAGLFGIRDWFRYCEFFGVFLRLIAGMAPAELVPAQPGRDGHWRLRAPFSGLTAAPAENPSLLIFVLFMLSSTAFDGLRETTLWHQWFWVDLYHAGLRDQVGANPLAAFAAMRELFMYWQSFWLLASPFLYLAVYLLCIEIARRITRCRMSLRQLSLSFALTLLPIALVYNVTHYYTLIQTQGVKIISLASDPLGRGWNLFGTAHWFQRTIIPDAATVWHVQVILIVAGHIVSVYLAHQIALKIFPTRRDALISQLPMLLLMVLFTTAGLWILSQPLQSG